jgi:hypothetical protein
MITKIEAAKRNIEFSIRCLFQEEDNLPIILVASSAFQVLRDIAEHQGVGDLHKSFKSMVAPGKEKEIWNAFNRVANFIKHADKKPGETLEHFNEELPETIILIACLYYYEIAASLSTEMSAFTKWLSVSKEELSGIWQVQSDAEPIVDFRELPRAERLKYGMSFIRTACSA